MRHGQSTYNALTMQQSSFAEPFVFDAELTLLGERQVCATVWPKQARKLRKQAKVTCQQHAVCPCCDEVVSLSMSREQIAPP